MVAPALPPDAVLAEVTQRDHASPPGVEEQGLEINSPLNSLGNARTVQKR